MNQTLRTALLVVLALAAAFSVVYLQHRFDEGDRKSALRIVEEYRAASTHQTIAEVLARRHPNGSRIVTATTDSSCFQYIRVRALVQDPDEHGTMRPFDYQFVVDINTSHIAPGNELGKEALADLDRPPSFSAAPASASASTSASALPVAPSASASAP